MSTKCGVDTLVYRLYEFVAECFEFKCDSRISKDMLLMILKTDDNKKRVNDFILTAAEQLDKCYSFRCNESLQSSFKFQLGSRWVEEYLTVSNLPLIKAERIEPEIDIESFSVVMHELLGIFSNLINNIKCIEFDSEFRNDVRTKLLDAKAIRFYFSCSDGIGSISDFSRGYYSTDTQFEWI